MYKARHWQVTRAMPGMHHVRQHMQDGSAQSKLAVMEAGSMSGDLLQVSGLPIRLLILCSCSLPFVQHTTTKLILTAFLIFLLNCLHVQS